MDPLCHTLVGAGLAEAGLKRRTRLGAITLLLAVNLPDVDILAGLTGHTLGFRRGWTHGVVAWVAMPLALTALVLAWDRWGPGRPAAQRVVPRQVWLLATVGVLTHPFLDWTNVYGVRLLMPFSERWFYGDALFIIDPWLWILLGAGVAWSLVRARRRRRAAPGPARASLVLAGLYIAGMLTLTSVARRAVARELGLRGRVSPRALMIAPVLLNPVNRDVVISLPEEYWFGIVGWTPRPELRLWGGEVRKNHDLPLLQRVEPSSEWRQFQRWARFPFYTVEGDPAAPRVRADDARYTWGERSWAAVSLPVR